jgi:hypothetical protein
MLAVNFLASRDVNHGHRRGDEAIVLLYAHDRLDANRMIERIVTACRSISRVPPHS